MNDQLPFFSIILPTYNRAHLLPRAIESVRQQSFPDWECLVIDDGSTDGTRQVVQRYKDTRIRYFFQENQEEGAARNAGIRYARGHYGCFLDDDDYFLPEHLARLAEAIRDQGEPVAVFRAGMLLEEAGRLKKGVLFDARKHSTPFDFFWNEFTGIISLCVHRDILRKYPFPAGFRLGADHHFEARVSAAYPFFQLPGYTCVCVRHPANKSGGSGDAGLILQDMAQHLACYEDLFRYPDQALQAHLTPRKKRHKRAMVQLMAVNRLLEAGQRQAARALLLRTARRYPQPGLWIWYLRKALKWARSIFEHTGAIRKRQGPV